MSDEPTATPRSPTWSFDPFARWRAAIPAPRLAPGERLLTEAALGRGDVAALTDRRVLVVGRHFERSLPLAHLALVHVRFERIVREIVAGAIALLIALILFAVAAPTRIFFLNQAASLESAAAQERASTAVPEGEATGAGHGPGLAQALQRMMRAFAAAASAIPVVAWLLVAAALAKVALGVFGRTVVVFTAGGSELRFERRGRDQLLREFITEVGGRLPGPTRPGTGVAAPTPSRPPGGPDRA
jgi:hypothetical protein